jgi:hypothetical protein
MRCGLSIERILFLNLDNCQGCGLYTGCGLYSQKYGNLFYSDYYFSKNIDQQKAETNHKKRLYITINKL